MRLSAAQTEIIKASIQQMAPQAEVKLFGSRADDTQRGGVIYLSVRAIDQFELMERRSPDRHSSSS